MLCSFKRIIVFWSVQEGLLLKLKSEGAGAATLLASLKYVAIGSSNCWDFAGTGFGCEESGIHISEPWIRRVVRYRISQRAHECPRRDLKHFHRRAHGEERLCATARRMAPKRAASFRAGLQSISCQLTGLAKTCPNNCTFVDATALVEFFALALIKVGSIITNFIEHIIRC